MRQQRQGQTLQESLQRIGPWSKRTENSRLSAASCLRAGMKQQQKNTCIMSKYVRYRALGDFGCLLLVDFFLVFPVAFAGVILFRVRSRAPYHGNSREESAPQKRTEQNRKRNIEKKKQNKMSLFAVERQRRRRETVCLSTLCLGLARGHVALQRSPNRGSKQR